MMPVAALEDVADRRILFDSKEQTRTSCQAQKDKICEVLLLWGSPRSRVWWGEP